MKDNCKKNLMIILNSKVIYYTTMIFSLILIFFGIGEKGYLICDDSPAYLACDGRVGIMPLYPLFLKGNQILFGESLYLHAVIIEQALFSIVCIILFTEFIRKRFKLSYLASYPVWLFSVFMPFTVNMPLSVSSHEIMTEAIAYPLFYLYMICFLKTIWDKQYKWIIISIFMSSCLALVRTQLQLVVVFSAAAFYYIAWMKGRKKNWKIQIIRGVFLVFVCVGIIGLGEGFTLFSNSLGQKIISSVNKSEEIEANTEQMEKNVNTTKNVTAQYGHLIIDKAVFEIDEDDYLLFDDIEMQKYCKKIYEVADEKHNRYVYIRKNLWAWEDIMNGIAGGTSVISQAWDRYLNENPDTYLTKSIRNEIAWNLLIEHLDRVLLHTFQMMLQGFVCTVFFQIAKFYGLCYLITLLIYLSAIVLVVWGYRNKLIANIYPEFLLGCVVINIIFVLILSTLFFAMQRYLIYCFGIFWVSYYLILLKVISFYWKKYKKDET